MNRRTVLRSLAALPLPLMSSGALPAPGGIGPSVRRVRPGGPGWPGAAQWARLDRAVGGRLVKVVSPFTAAAADPGSAAAAELFEDLADPFYIGQDVALTENLGWTGAWTSRASAYAVQAASSADVAAAVDFAREHHVRLVVKGGGHSYLGGSNAPDSLLVWTRPMQDVRLHDAFVPLGAAGRAGPEAAVSLGAGALWIDAYNAVTTVAGRYVQGGGCTTVGVAGLVQGGGFGSFSKGFGTAAANLLEAEVVTADGAVRTVNAFRDPDLFWALKGGGGGTFGVVTRLTLRTHELPAYFGVAHAVITAASDSAYLTLVEQFLAFYRESLFNPHWGEQITFGPGRRISVNMLFQGLDQAQAVQTWAPLFAWITARPDDYTLTEPEVGAIPAQGFWNPAVVGAVPGTIVRDDLPGAPPYYFAWAGDAGQSGQVLYGYQSTWLSQRLLDPQGRPRLADALVRAGRLVPVTLHCNKGIAGAGADAVHRTADTSMNPAVTDSFALAVAAATQGPAYPGVAGHEPDVALGRLHAKQVAAAMAPLKGLDAQPASYVSETDYFESDWQTAFWGGNYARLLRVKRRYDPDGLFFVHHSVGTES